MKILLVEDDATTRLLMERKLRGFDVDVAINGFEALDKVKAALIKNDYYNLILQDIELPKMQGIQVIKVVRLLEEVKGLSMGQAAKIIMLTSRDDAKTVMASFREQCDAYLIKPFSKDKFDQELLKLGLFNSEK